MDYVLSPAARSDLGSIWDYTAENWGIEQADRYILGIRNACEALAAGDRKGHVRSTTFVPATGNLA